MKNPNETTSTADDLPGFLQLEEVAHDSIAAESMSAATSNDTSSDEPQSLDDVTAATLDEATASSDAAGGGGGDTTDTAPSRPAGTVASSRAGAVSMFTGFAAIAAAAAVAALPLADATRDTMSRFGVEPASLLVVGTILAASGTNRRRIAMLQRRLDDNSGSNHDGVASLRESVQFLVESQHASNERPPAAGEELQHVLIALQRQDDKINNLTKAIKMYGKPLMEISGQSTEIAGAVAQAKAAVEAKGDATQKTLEQLRTQLHQFSGTHKEIADLTDIVLKVSAMVETLQKKSGGTLSLEPLQQQVGRLEVGLAAIAQRVEDNELRKSLLRLEDSTAKAREDVQHLLRGEGLQKATNQLQERLDKATTRLSDGLTQMRDGNLGSLESSIRELQRELSGVATTVAQIQVAVKGGARSAAASISIAPAAAPAPGSAAAAATHHADTAAPTAAAPAPNTAPPANDTGASGYQTGKRTSTGKNVLGAIAKLKQMKN